MPRFNLRTPRFSTLGLLEGIAAANAEEAQDIQNQNNLALLQQRNLNNNILEATGLDIALADLATTQATQTITEAKAAEAPALAQAEVNKVIQQAFKEREGGLANKAKARDSNASAKARPLVAASQVRKNNAQAGAAVQSGKASAATAAATPLIAKATINQKNSSANASSEQALNIKLKRGFIGAQSKADINKTQAQSQNIAVQQILNQTKFANEQNKVLINAAKVKRIQELQALCNQPDGSPGKEEACRQLNPRATTDEGSAFDNSVSNTAGSF